MEPKCVYIGGIEEIECHDGQGVAPIGPLHDTSRELNDGHRGDDIRMLAHTLNESFIQSHLPAGHLHGSTACDCGDALLKRFQHIDIRGLNGHGDRDPEYNADDR